MKKKGKVTKIFWGLKSFYFTWVLEALYYQGGCIGWVGEVQIIKIYPQTKVSSVARHIQIANQIPETFAKHVGP
jgi:hypothetical protein